MQEAGTAGRQLLCGFACEQDNLFVLLYLQKKLVLNKIKNSEGFFCLIAFKIAPPNYRMGFLSSLQSSRVSQTWGSTIC